MSDKSTITDPLSQAVTFHQTRKRNGELAPFSTAKITDAILKAACATGEFGCTEARQLTIQILNLARAVVEHEVPDVEEIQDLVEAVLLDA